MTENPNGLPSAGEPPANDSAAPRPAAAPVDEFALLPRKSMWRKGGGRPAAVDRWWQTDDEDTEPAD